MRGFDRRVRVFSLSDWGETISTYKLLDGSGQGDRASGVFASLSSSAVAAAKTSTIETTEIGTSPGDSEEEEFVSDEINDEGDSDQVQDVTSEETTSEETLEEIIEEIEKEEAQELGLGTEDAGAWKRQMLASPSRSRYVKLDEVVLVGRNAFQ